MEIKIECSCGQRYKFDVEPENGLMPMPVGCPSCGLDGTDAANGFIQQVLAIEAPPPEKPPLRIGAAAAVPPPAEPPLGGAMPQGVRQGKAAAAAPTLRRAGRSSPVLGIMGALGGGLVGMIAWYLLIKITHYEIGYAAWGVGVLAGLGARLLGRQTSTLLGVTAGICAFLAIVGGQFLAARAMVKELFQEASKEAYEAQLTYAKEAIQAIPNGSDAEIRAFLTKQGTEDGEPAGTAGIAQEDVKDFRERRLPELRDLVSGKRTRVDVDKQIQAVRDSLVGDLLILKETLSLWTILWLFLGIGSAYKIGSGG